VRRPWQLAVVKCFVVCLACGSCLAAVGMCYAGTDLVAVERLFESDSRPAPCREEQATRADLERLAIGSAEQVDVGEPGGR
jgi:hypothetical protein